MPRVTLENCASRPGAKNGTCKVCNKPFVLDSLKGWKATRVYVQTIRNSRFRGEDTVNFYHPECFDNRHDPTGDTKCQS